MNIIEALEDASLFRRFLADENDSLESWSGWFSVLRAIYGLPLSDADHELLLATSGRHTMPTEGFDISLLLVGRRSGKSRIAACIAAYEACLSGNESRLSPGERGVVMVCSPTKQQSTIVKSYVRAIFESSSMLSNEVVRENVDGFELDNGVTIQIGAANFQSVRGWSIICVCVDELCFVGVGDNVTIRSDTELVRALLPALATTRGKLIGISSPYAQRGYAYTAWKKHHGNETGTTLVLQAPSRTLNPTLQQKIIDAAMLEDAYAARSEYFAEWRADISAFVPPEVIAACVVDGRKELRPDSRRTYAAFVDVSGGIGDSAALAIGHREGRKIVIDLCREWTAPHAPDAVVSDMVAELKRYGLKKVVGDAYSGNWVKDAFACRGVVYARSTSDPFSKSPIATTAKPRSQLYLDLLPRLTSGDVELLDDPKLIQQLCSLERKVRSGGRDVVDHPPGEHSHDDLANVVAGACMVAATYRVTAGGNIFAAGTGDRSMGRLARALETVEAHNEYEQYLSKQGSVEKPPFQFYRH